MITGFTAVMQEALGNGDFIWVLAIEVFIGIMVAFFQKSGAIRAFGDWVNRFNLKRRGATGLAWLLGMFIWFSDYFSPLYVGNVMRPITDKAKVAREKLAYICDSTSAPIISLIPFSSWGIYVAGLMVGIGVITDARVAQSVMMQAWKYNFYGLFAIAFTGLISFKIIPDFGPMKKAEERAYKEGKVIGDGAKPLLSKELENIKPKEGIKTNLFINFFAPALIIIVITVSTYVLTGSALTLEGLVTAVVFQFICMLVQKMGTIEELVEVASEGIKSVMSAILILSLAYCLNHISGVLGTANYVISVTEAWMTPTLLVVMTFLICAFTSFFTGTSWGTYAIMTPIALPLALTLSGNQIDMIVFAVVGAIMGGGCFGDHCSPISDTTILSSLAAGSDHIDHVKTQIPYAVICGGLACLGGLVVGMIY
ncbi:MAG: Na+/H+ antiporter NhaC family protein [Tissierellia bacterium]|nr:Na+/H+ antiporter NhaC family protein [Tissierellia bacterium]